MSKKTKAADAGDNIDDLIGDAPAPAAKKTRTKAAAAPAPAAKKTKAAAAAPAPAAKKTKAAAPAPAAKKAKTAVAAPAADSLLRKALLKVKKAVSYADFAEANDFNIRSVRRAARAMRDAGEIELTRDGQTVFISAAV